ncbi:MAG: hypothetical protein AAGG47_20475 [Pseudomonadota bacterium]
MRVLFAAATAALFGSALAASAQSESETTFEDMTEARGLFGLWVCEADSDAPICADDAVQAARNDLIFTVAERIAALPQPRTWLVVDPTRAAARLEEQARFKCGADLDCIAELLIATAETWSQVDLTEAKPALASRPSFPCPDTASRTAIAICSDRDLGTVEKSLANTIRKIAPDLQSLGIYHELEQERWEVDLERRCGADTLCLTTAFMERSEEISVWEQTNKRRLEDLRRQQKQAKREAQRLAQLAEEERRAALPVVDPAPGFDDATLDSFLRHVYRGDFETARAERPQRTFGGIRRIFIEVVASHAKQCEGRIANAPVKFRTFGIETGETLGFTTYIVPERFAEAFKHSILKLYRRTPGAMPGATALGSSWRDALAPVGCDTPQSWILMNNFFAFVRRHESLQAQGIVPSAFALSCLRGLPASISDQPGSACKCLETELPASETALRFALADTFTESSLRDALAVNPALADAYGRCDLP